MCMGCWFEVEATSGKFENKKNGFLCWFYPIFKTSKADLMETNERLSKKMSLQWMKIQNFAQNSEEKLEKETFAMTV